MKEFFFVGKVVNNFCDRERSVKMPFCCSDNLYHCEERNYPTKTSTQIK